MQPFPKLISPLAIPQTQTKRFILNLNVYRNTHYRSLNTVKQRYKDHMQAQIQTLVPLESVEPVFVLYPATRRLCDVSNVCAIHEKFCMDALVELGKLPDDNYRYVARSLYAFGQVDKHHPRVEVILAPTLQEYLLCTSSSNTTNCAPPCTST